MASINGGKATSVVDLPESLLRTMLNNDLPVGLLHLILDNSDSIKPLILPKGRGRPHGTNPPVAFWPDQLANAYVLALNKQSRNGAPPTVTKKAMVEERFGCDVRTFNKWLKVNGLPTEMRELGPLILEEINKSR